MKTYTENQKNILMEWVELLLSGEFTQSRYTLYDSKENGFCCLGIACFGGLAKEMPVEEGGQEETGMALPFAGLNDRDIAALAQLNDTYKFTFEEIAYIVLLSIESGETIGDMYYHWDGGDDY